MTKHYSEILDYFDLYLKTNNPYHANFYLAPFDILNMNDIPGKNGFSHLDTYNIFRSLKWWNNGSNHLIFSMIPNLDFLPNNIKYISHYVRQEYNKYRNWNIISSQLKLSSTDQLLLSRIHSTIPGTLTLFESAPPEYDTDMYRSLQQDVFKVVKYVEILQQSIFCLILPNQYLTSLDLSEAIMQGCIPVIMNIGDIILPYHDVLDYSKFTVMSHQPPSVEFFLNLMDSYKHKPIFYDKLVRRGRLTWAKYFSRPTAIARTCAHILKQRLFPYGGRKYKDWNSDKYWEDKSFFEEPTAVSTPYTNSDAKGTLHEFCGDDIRYTKDGTYHNSFKKTFDYDINPIIKFAPEYNNHLQNKSFRGGGDKFSAVIIVYDRHFLTSLNRIIETLKEVPSLSHIYLVLNIAGYNGNGPSDDIFMWLNRTLSSAKLIKILNPLQRSRNNRFNSFFSNLNLSDPTQAILSLNQATSNLLLTNREIEIAFQVWKQFPDRIINPRSTYPIQTYNKSYEGLLDISNDAIFIHKHFFHLYTYRMDPEIKRYIDKVGNCEDIAMNLLALRVTGNTLLNVRFSSKLRCNKRCKNLIIDNNDQRELRERCLKIFYGYFFGNLEKSKSIISKFQFSPLEI
ncbi:unnamed protein product [Gordionus sp. m RMFG-2023]